MAFLPSMLLLHFPPWMPQQHAPTKPCLSLFSLPVGLGSSCLQTTQSIEMMLSHNRFYICSKL
eukprot:1584036-Amphidinium_carterae.1